MLNKNIVENHFSRAAKTYEDNAIIQKDMAINLIKKAENSGRDFSRILEIGCGTGYLTRLLSIAFPKAKIFATDISPLMLVQAEKRHPPCQNKPEFFQQDGENLSVTGTFDLIISNAAFQWFTDYDKAFSGFASRLASEGLLLYSTFGPATFNELHSAFLETRKRLQLAADEKHGPDFISAGDLVKSAHKSGLDCALEESLQRVFFPCAKDFLQSIKKIGATHAPKTPVTFNRRLLPETLKHYDRHFRSSAEEIYATYHIIAGAAQKISCG